MILLDNGNLLVDLHPIAKNIINTIQDDASINLSDTEAYATNYLVTNLVEQGLLDKIKALYGFIGGTAATHRWNWKDMRDLDTAYRITWGGTVIHSSAGIVSDGVTGYGNTHINSNIYSSSNFNIFTYINQSGNGIDWGADSTSSYLWGSSNFNNTLRLFVKEGGINISNTSLSKTGLFEYNRLGNVYNILINERLSASITISTGIIPSREIYLLARNAQAASNFFSTNRISLAIFTDETTPLTSQESLLIKHIITTYNRILNRA